MQHNQPITFFLYLRIKKELEIFEFYYLIERNKNSIKSIRKFN